MEGGGGIIPVGPGGDPLCNLVARDVMVLALLLKRLALVLHKHMQCQIGRGHVSVRP